MTASQLSRGFALQPRPSNRVGNFLDTGPIQKPSRRQLHRLQLALEQGEQRWLWGASQCQPHPRLFCQRNKQSCLVSASSAPSAQVDSLALESDILTALRRIIDPDLGKDVVDCGFVRDLRIDHQAGGVDFTLRLTTPACPVKDDFRKKAEQYVGEIGSQGLSKVAHIIAVSSCKGGVGKSTTAVNLAYTLAQMGAKVGIFDADVYGPSLPTMVSPELRVLKMNPETRSIEPLVYEGVKAVSFGFAGQGSAIMRGPMVSGVVQQLLTTTEWGELDYLVVDFPPGTGDIQLTLCQTVAFSAAVIVTTPQKLAFLDVAKGIRMFARLAVPCVAVVENMAYFDADGKRYHPFGKGSGERIVRDFGLPNLCRFPIEADLSAAGDGGRPLVVSNPTSATANAFMDLGAAVVREVAKLSMVGKASARYVEDCHAIAVKLPEQPLELYLDPAVVRRNDTSAKSVNEWTGEKILQDSDIADSVRPAAMRPLGNYAMQIDWEDGFNQVAPFEQLEGLPHLSSQDLSSRQRPSISAPNGVQPAADNEPPQNATQRLMAAASRR
ncbi:hypothetical protein WJX74_003321 [Apatococcus lobatus]|uniref:Uncharacterized protein n=1 Tax=Apatococcus lobatus TaxID=904363 RepID=A0AAW1S9Z7_9CHLO